MNPVTPAGTLLTVPGTRSVGNRTLAEALWDAHVRQKREAAGAGAAAVGLDRACLELVEGHPRQARYGARSFMAAAVKHLYGACCV